MKSQIEKNKFSIIKNDPNKTDSYQLGLLFLETWKGKIFPNNEITT